MSEKPLAASMTLYTTLPTIRGVLIWSSRLFWICSSSSLKGHFEAMFAFAGKVEVVSLLKESPKAVPPSVHVPDTF